MGAAFAGFFIIWLFFVGLSLVNFVFWIMAIVDSAQRPDWQWVVAGTSKVTWLILIILVPFCNLVYWFGTRKRLIVIALHPPPGVYAAPMMAYQPPPGYGAPPGYAPPPMYGAPPAPGGWQPPTGPPPTTPPPPPALPPSPQS
jgi:hypothetical protein